MLPSAILTVSNGHIFDCSYSKNSRQSQTHPTSEGCFVDPSQCTFCLAKGPSLLRFSKSIDLRVKDVDAMYRNAVPWSVLTNRRLKKGLSLNSSSLGQQVKHDHLTDTWCDYQRFATYSGLDGHPKNTLVADSLLVDLRLLACLHVHCDLG